MRKPSGYTQVEFAADEAPDSHPPAHLLPQMAQAPGVSVEVLLGISLPRRPKKLATNLLERRLMAIEKLNTTEKREILKIIDTFIERGKLKQRITAQEAA